MTPLHYFRNPGCNFSSQYSDHFMEQVCQYSKEACGFRPDNLSLDNISHSWFGQVKSPPELFFLKKKMPPPQ